LPGCSGGLTDTGSKHYVMATSPAGAVVRLGGGRGRGTLALSGVGVIAPIETRYAGCRFRSRLEARWAVFFDHLGIEWLYEPEGYKLPSGSYLPDFLIHPHTEFAFWLEIKPTLPDVDSREAKLLKELADTTQIHAFMYCRQPGSPVPLTR
jgi:hypothetical protein